VTLRWLVASLHLLALPLGLGAVFARARALRGALDGPGLARVFRADALWGLAAVVWVGTGLARAFGGLEKGAAYYLGAHVFWVKMSLLGSILVLEVWPMVTLIRWRARAAKGEAIDMSSARDLALISDVQAGFVVLMVFAATALARGIGS
jgi:putative membrane protein